MPTRWAHTKAAFYVRAVAELGMSISPEAAARMIDSHVTLVASQLGITPQSARRYVDDEALQAMAASEVARHSDEAPGATITLLPADRDLPVATAGQIILGLLAATELSPGGTPQSQISNESLVQAAAAVAYFQTQSPPGTVRVPQALVRRCARYLRASSPATTQRRHETGRET